MNRRTALGLLGVWIIGLTGLGLGQTIAASDQDSYIVLLRAPSVVDRVLSATRGRARPAGQRLFRSPELSDLRREVGISQEQSVERIVRAITPRGPGAFARPDSGPVLEVLARRSFLTNMLVIRGRRSIAETLRRHPDVKAVYPNYPCRPQMDTAPSVVNAPPVWEMLGGPNQGGLGVRIAIIDSGINQAHPIFDDPSLPIPSDFDPPGEFREYTTRKVIAARNYVKTEFGYNAQDIKTPQDELGHGTEVAGIAAGRPVDTPYASIQGIAPKAYLGNYKVFGKPGTNDEARTAAIIAALNDALEDGMDIANLSLGSTVPIHPGDDPYMEAIAKATEAGMLVVVAAGNAGTSPGSVTSPGTSPDALTVGATLNARYWAARLEVTTSSAPLPPGLDTVGYVPAANQAVDEKVGPTPLASVFPLDPTGLCCSPLPAGALQGKMLLVMRGTCLFAEKAENAAAAGASGIVVFQNTDEPPIVMGSVDPTQRAVMIDKRTGEVLRDFLASESAAVTLHPQTSEFSYPSPYESIAGFSGCGPDLAFHLKPDLVAPGRDILTATLKTVNEGLYVKGRNGTSYAAPIVSGAAALLLQFHPTWDPRAVKSALVSTAEKVLKWNGEPATAIRRGNGLLNLQRAAKAEAAADPVTLSYGIVRESSVGDLEQTLTIKNLHPTLARTYSADLVETTPHPSVQTSVSPPAVTLGPGEEGHFVVHARVSAPLSHGPFEGLVRVVCASDPVDLTVPYWGGVSTREDRTLTVAAAGAASYTSLSEALLDARPGSTIEIRDSGIYQGGLSIGMDPHGIPLDELTVRALSGESPRISAAGSPGISLVGVNRVQIDKLTIGGGTAGLSAFYSTGAIRDVEVVDCGTGMEFTRSQFTVLNGTVTGAHNEGILAASSRLNVRGILLQDSGLEGVALIDSPALITKTVIRRNKREGIFNSSRATLGLFDSTIEENSATGVLLYQTPALLKGNLIQASTGGESDGLLAFDSGADVRLQDNQILNNDRHGVQVLMGATLESVGNRIQGNRKIGLFLSEAEGAAEQTWLRSNGRGIRSEASELFVTDSIIAGSTSIDGDGLYVDGGRLTLLSSTIAANRRKGVRLVAASHTIANSILYGNSGGDLDGGKSGSVLTNIIGDGTLNGSNGNIRTNPNFVDSARLDFSLPKGSPAIDASRSDQPFSQIDALAHIRSTDGNGDAAAKPDLGALEYNSDNWTPLVLPILSVRTDEFVGLAMANNSSQQCRVRLEGYAPNGGRFAAYEKTIEPASQFSILLKEALGTLWEGGWVEIRSDRPNLVSFSLLGNYGLTRMDGCEIGAAVSTRLVLPEVAGGGSNSTSLFVVNPNHEPVSVMFRWMGSSSLPLTKTTTLRARGSFNELFSDLFGNEYTGGYLIIEAAKPIFAMELFGSDKSQGGLLGLDADGAASTLFGAQLAWSSSLDTTLNIINVGGSAADFTIEAIDESGKVVKSVRVPALGSGRQYRKTARELFALGRDLVGWVKVTATGGRLLGSLSFSDSAGNFLAALPLQSAGAREFSLSHVAETSDVFTGVTLLNATEQYAQVSVEVFDRSGAGQGLSLFELRPQEKQARLLSEHIPHLPRLDGGFIRVRSNVPLFGFELFASTTLSFMSAVPAQVLAH